MDIVWLDNLNFSDFKFPNRYKVYFVKTLIIIKNTWNNKLVQSTTLADKKNNIFYDSSFRTSKMIKENNYGQNVIDCCHCQVWAE